MRNVVEIAEGVRSGKLKAEEVLGEYLAAIETQNAELNSFVFLDSVGAMEQAREIDRRVAAGEDPGPLAGVPFGVKDIEDCQNMPTTKGSMLLKDSGPQPQDSVHVARMRAAGAIPLGKTATAEFGMDSATFTKAWGVSRNPWNTDKTPGGSSGGSAAAVAAGMVPIATATDAGGSIREPAAFTGLVGLKPSHGRIPKGNGFSNWSVVGVLTADVKGTARYLDVAAGPDDRDRQSLPAYPGSYEQACEKLDVSGLKALWSSDYGYAAVEPEIETIARRAAERLIDAAALSSVEMPFAPVNVYPHLGGILLHNLYQDFVRDGIWPAQRQLLSAPVEHLLQRIEDAGEIDIAASWQQVHKLEQQVAELFDQCDLLLSPATSCRPYGADSLTPTEVNGKDATDFGAEPFGMMANVCWNPSISIPAGITSDGLPVGLQITARRHCDDVLLRLARIFEQLQPWSFPWDK